MRGRKASQTDKKEKAVYLGALIIWVLGIYCRFMACKSATCHRGAVSPAVCQNWGNSQNKLQTWCCMTTEQQVEIQRDAQESGLQGQTRKRLDQTRVCSCTAS
ncbi:hypothetical protein RRG08_018506 [Elysia crispata]|uniref:Uncharacterized protein n=1 Tax=Elysia crispata TaxID=231223 RepID=A0AAE1AE48_9GAST|nr:hypothetical protein RRG08_018506 [Elysia crispata]